MSSLLLQSAQPEDYLRLAGALDYALTYGLQPSEEWVDACHRSRERARIELQRLFGATRVGLHTTSQICTNKALRVYHEKIMHADITQEPEQLQQEAKEAFKSLQHVPPSVEMTACVWENGTLQTVLSLFVPFGLTGERCTNWVSDAVGRPVKLYQDDMLTHLSQDPLTDPDCTLYVDISQK